jgi:hypothetical protein
MITLNPKKVFQIKQRHGIQNDTDDSSESLPEICDSEIEEYSSMIPSNWDDAFN